MKGIKLAYDYLFFTFYRFWEKAPSKWWSDLKAAILISFLNIFALLSIYGIVMYKLKVNLLPKSGTLPIVISLIIFVLNYLYFLRQERWRIKIEKFDDISDSMDKIGVTIVISLVLALTVLLIYTIYLISTVDWQNLR